VNLIALLSWFDEQPQHLTDLITSIAQAGCTHLVAVDGPYQLYPSDTIASSPEQHDAILATSHALGLHVTLHVPEVPWPGNEVEKRTLLFKLGHAHANPYRDWLWVCDGDEVITDVPPDLQDRLEKTSRNAAAVFVYEHSQADGMPLRKLFRAHPRGIFVEDNHAYYLTGDRDILWRPGAPALEVAAEQWNDVRVQHRPGHRTKPRLKARDTYYQRRNKHNTERWA